MDDNVTVPGLGASTMKCSGNHTSRDAQLIVAGDEVSGGDEDATFADLLESVAGIIIAFQTQQDRLSTALVCRGMRDAVEHYSQQLLMSVFEDHGVDTRRGFLEDTLEARIYDQSSIITDLPRPVDLPWRYLYSALARTYLYKLHQEVDTDGDVDDEESWQSISHMELSPREDRLITVEKPCYRIRVWDLNEKRILFTGQHVDAVSSEQNGKVTAYIVGNRLVSVSICKIYVWIETNEKWEISDELTQPDLTRIYTCVPYKKELLFTSVEWEGGQNPSSFDICALDLALGTSRKLSTINVTKEYQTDSCFAEPKEMFLCGSKSLVISVCGVIRQHEENFLQSVGLHVFDLNTFSQKIYFLPFGSIAHLYQPLDCTRILIVFAMSYFDNLMVFRLNEEEDAFELSSSADVPEHLVAVSKSQFFGFEHPYSDTLWACNIITGERQRSWDPMRHGSYFDSGSIFMERNELLLAHVNGAGAVVTTTAYLLKEPCL